MDEQKLAQIMVASVRMTARHLSDEELNAICMVANLGTNPKHVIGYEKAKPLFTEQDETRMHPTTLAALMVIWKERFPGR